MLTTPSPTPRRLRIFALSLGVVLACLGVGYLLRGARSASWTLFTASAVLLALGALRPGWLSEPYRLWMALGLGLGFVMSRAALFVVYFVVITPMGLVMRLAGRDRLALGKGAKPCWQRVSEDPRGKRRYHSQFLVE